MYQGARRTRKAWNIDGNAHCLTFSCFKRQPFFRSERTPKWFLETVDRARRKTPFDLWAYVVMPEHVHLVLLPHDGVRMESILWQLKRPMTRRVIAWVEKNHPAFLGRMTETHRNGSVTYRFWQPGGGYDRNLRSVADAHEKIHYVHGNPIRRGLVDRAEDWIWSSARGWTTGEDDWIALDRGSLPPLVT
jgi:putative transposase